MNYIILAVSLCLGVSKNLVSKAGRKVFDGVANLMTANIITALTALVIFGVFGVSFSEIKGGVLLLAMLYGLFTMGSQSLYILAVKNGSVSVCSLIYASSFLIPTVFSTIAYREAFSAVKIIGIAVMLISILMVSYKGKGQESGGMTGISFVFVFLAMLSAGSVGIIQKIIGHSFENVENGDFLFVAFCFMLAFSLAVKIAVTLKNKEKIIPADKSFFAFALALAVSQVVANKLNMFLVAVMSGMVFFPVINGGTIIVSSVGSRIMFKEKLGAIQIFGIAIGIVALILIAI